MRSLAGVMLSAFLIACTAGSSSTTFEDGGATDGASGVDGGTSGADGSTTPAIVCTGSSTCTPGQTCEIAQATTVPANLCTIVLTCDSNGTFPTPPVHCLDSGQNAPACPATFTSLPEEAACPSNITQCFYPEGSCHCAVCADAGTAPVWHCTSYVPVPAGCPSNRPLLGAACTSEGQSCDYAQSCDCGHEPLGPTMACTGGVWVAVVLGQGGGTCSCPGPTCL